MVAAPCTFIRVLHGSGVALLCNIDCSCLHLMSFIRDKCAPDLDVLALELCTEKGRLSGGGTMCCNEVRA